MDPSWDLTVNTFEKMRLVDEVVVSFISFIFTPKIF